jgi:hypothetical protein
MRLTNVIVENSFAGEKRNKDWSQKLTRLALLMTGNCDKMLYARL